MASMQPENSQSETIEDLIDKTGWGIYYKFLVGFTAVNAFCNGLACSTIPFALIFVVCDAITLQDVLGLNIAFMFGKGFGGFLLCSVSDYFGKKYIITETLIVIFCSMFLAAFSHNSHTFYLAIFVLGAHVQANYSCSKIHLAELIPKKKRCQFLVMVDILWTFAYLLSAVCYYFLAEYTMRNNEPSGIRLTSWRALFAVPGGFSLVLACASGLLEISPRFVLFKKQRNLAFVILKQFYAINRSKYSENYSIKEEQLNGLVKDYDLTPDIPPHNCVENFCLTGYTVCRICGLLWQTRFVATILIIIIIRISMMLGIVGLNIFLARSLNSANCSLTGTELLHLTLPTEKDNCQSTYNNPKLFQYFFLIAGCIFIGQTLSLLVINRLGRKFHIFSGLVICGAASFLLAEFEYAILRLLASIVFMLAFSSLDSVISIVTIEVFPTALRGTAAGNVHFYSNVVAIIFYWFLNFPCQYLFYITGAFMAGSCILAFFIPNRRGRPMVE